MEGEHRRRSHLRGVSRDDGAWRVARFDGGAGSKRMTKMSTDPRLCVECDEEKLIEAGEMCHNCYSKWKWANRSPDQVEKDKTYARNYHLKNNQIFSN